MEGRIKKNIEYTLSTFAIDGLKPSEEALRLYERMEKGELSLSGTIAEIERMYGLNGKHI